MAEKIRFTISVDADVHAAFVEMAETAGQSLSSTVGAWLADTTESARFVSMKMRELRMAPSLALQELAVVQERAAQETRGLAASWTADGRPSVPTRSGRARTGLGGAEGPPSSLTGVNTLGKPSSPKRGKP